MWLCQNALSYRVFPLITVFLATLKNIFLCFVLNFEALFPSTESLLSARS